MTTITISGLPGSGKSTVAELLQKQLGLEYIYSGKIFREMAIKYNMDLDEFGRFCEKNKDIDEKLDDYQLNIIKKGNVIVEGRISGWLAYRNDTPTFKIFLQADLETRVNRIIKRENGDFEKRKSEILERERSEEIRYKKYYNINIDDTSIYDLVINTADKSPKKILNIILNNLNK